MLFLQSKSARRGAASSTTQNAARSRTAGLPLLACLCAGRQERGQGHWRVHNRMHIRRGMRHPKGLPEQSLRSHVRGRARRRSRDHVQPGDVRCRLHGGFVRQYVRMQQVYLLRPLQPRLPLALPQRARQASSLRVVVPREVSQRPLRVVRVRCVPLLRSGLRAPGGATTVAAVAAGVATRGRLSQERGRGRGRGCGRSACLRHARRRAARAIGRGGWPCVRASRRPRHQDQRV